MPRLCSAARLLRATRPSHVLRAFNGHSAQSIVCLPHSHTRYGGQALPPIRGMKQAICHTCGQHVLTQSTSGAPLQCGQCYLAPDKVSIRHLDKLRGKATGAVATQASATRTPVTERRELARMEFKTAKDLVACLRRFLKLERPTLSDACEVQVHAGNTAAGAWPVLAVFAHFEVHGACVCAACVSN